MGENRSTTTKGAATFVRRVPAVNIGEEIDWQGECGIMLTAMFAHQESKGMENQVLVGILTDGKSFCFVTLQASDDGDYSSQAWVDGPVDLYTRLDNRNWRAGDSHCTDF